jgi:predicted transcriptional regulator
MNKKVRLTNRELDIMNILWDSSQGMTASSICKVSDNLSINTVQATLKSLLKKKAIEVDKIVYSGKVLTRSYKANLSISQYIKHNFSSNTFDIAASLINSENDPSKIEKFSKLLEEKKSTFRKE